MRGRIRRSTILALAIAAAAFWTPVEFAAQAPAAACSRAWVGHEAEFERALADGRVTKLEDLPIGVTKPVRGTLDPPAPVAHFTWKPLTPGYRKGFRESYEAEIAAYKLDRLLELGMVPPVIEREV